MYFFFCVCSYWCFLFVWQAPNNGFWKIVRVVHRSPSHPAAPGCSCFVFFFFLDLLKKPQKNKK